MIERLFLVVPFSLSLPNVTARSLVFDLLLLTDVSAAAELERPVVVVTEANGGAARNTAVRSEIGILCDMIFLRWQRLCYPFHRLNFEPSTRQLFVCPVTGTGEDAYIPEINRRGLSALV